VRRLAAALAEAECSASEYEFKRDLQAFTIKEQQI
jgi:hypothetical protein